jgi:geranylgeranyl diphosphate synthase type II
MPGTAAIEPLLDVYRRLTASALIHGIPRDGPQLLYDLVADYPSRGGKGLRPALCLATCATFGGDIERALNTAVAIELFHNAFLIHDDIQDESEQRRGKATLHSMHGTAIALNVGNATNLLGLQRVVANSATLGSTLAQVISTETEVMLRQSLEGQALELAWIRSNACNQTDADYYRMCLKKTSWYTCIYPCRTGVAIAATTQPHQILDRYAWFLGAAFQIQDDLLNLSGNFDCYGKEILGDLWEGKRTLMIIHLLNALHGEEHERLQGFLGQSRSERSASGVRWVYDTMCREGSLEHARESAVALAAQARQEAELALCNAPDSIDRSFLLDLPDYVIKRSR